MLTLAGLCCGCPTYADIGFWSIGRNRSATEVSMDAVHVYKRSRCCRLCEWNSCIAVPLTDWAGMIST